MILSALVVLGWSLGAWAQTPAPGVTFDEVITFSDGTVQVRVPRLRGSRINSDSDRTGVCRILGYPGALNAQVEPETNSEINCSAASLRIDQHGRVQGRNECGFLNSNATIKAIRCHPVGYRYTVPNCLNQVEEGAPASCLERVDNGDGTVTLYSPWFSRQGVDPRDLRERFYVHAGSDMNGVCRHFGLGAYVNGSVVAEDRCEIPARRDDRTVRLDQTGRFAEESTCGAHAIFYMVCRR